MSEVKTITLDRVITRSTYFEIQRNLYGREEDPRGKKIALTYRDGKNDDYYHTALNLYRGLYKSSLRLPKARLFIGDKPNKNWEGLMKIESSYAKKLLYDMEYIIKAHNTDIIPNDAFLLYYYFVIRDHKDPSSIKGKVTIKDFIPVMQYAIDPSAIQLDMSRLHPDFQFTMTIKEFVLILLFYIIIEKPDEFKKQFENAILIMREFKDEICNYFDDCGAVFAKMERIYSWATDPNTSDIDPDNFLDFMKYIASLNEALSDERVISSAEDIARLEKDYGKGLFKYTMHDVNQLIDKLEGDLVRYFDIINSNYELEENGFEPNNYLLGIIYELMSAGYYPAVTAGVLPASAYLTDPTRESDDKDNYFPVDYCVPDYWCQFYFSSSKGSPSGRSNGIYIAKDQQPNGDLPLPGEQWSPEKSIWSESILNTFKQLSDLELSKTLRAILARIKSGAFDGLYRGINFSSITPMNNAGGQLDTAMFHRYLASHIASHILVASVGAEFTYKVATLASYDKSDKTLRVMPFHSAPAVFPRIRIETENNKFVFHVDDKNGWATAPLPNQYQGSWTDTEYIEAPEVIDSGYNYNLDNLNVFEVDKNNPELRNVIPDLTLVGMQGSLNKTNDLSVHIEATAEQSNVSDMSKVYDYSDPGHFIADIVAYANDNNTKMPLFRINNFSYTEEKKDSEIEIIDPEKNY